MRNLYRKAFFIEINGKKTGYRRATRCHMRQWRTGDMLDPAHYNEVFGTDPEHWPKNRYQWRMIMTEALKSDADW